MLMLPFADHAAPPPPPNRPRNAADPEVDEQLEEEEDERSVGEEVSATLLAMMPWAISFLFHAIIVVIALVVIFRIIPALEEDETKVVSTNLADKPQEPMQTQLQEKSEQAEPRAVTVQNPEVTNTTSLTDATTFESAAIGEFAAPPSAAVTGFGEIGGAGTGGLGFAGMEAGNAQNIVFVLDASGSLIDTLPFVVEELKTFLRKFASSAGGKEANFEVIFFQGGERTPIGDIEYLRNVDDLDRIRELASARLARSSARWKKFDRDNVAVVDRWLDAGVVEPGGKTDPLPALELALSLRSPKPDAIILLSDNITGLGVSEIEQRELLNSIKNLNTQGIQIKTIQFLHEDPLVKHGGERTLRLIADESGGEHTFFSKHDLLTMRMNN